MDDKLFETLDEIKNILIKNNLALSSAESCTGGLVSSYLTDIAGAGNFIFQNFVTYSNEAKTRFLNVKKETLEKFGAVSNQTAHEMALGLLNYARASIATTGILGPTGASKGKPIGLCYIGLGLKETKKPQEIVEIIKYISPLADTNDRCKIKTDIARHAIFEFLKFIKKNI